MDASVESVLCLTASKKIRKTDHREINAYSHHLTLHISKTATVQSVTRQRAEINIFLEMKVFGLLMLWLVVVSVVLGAWGYVENR